MLEIKDLGKDYFIDNQPFHALSEISLSFPDVQFVSVLGPSGCGKTTFLNLIGGLDSITSGDIIVDDKSLKGMDEKEKDSYRNNYIGFIFQDYYLIPQLTILDNVKIALAVRDFSPKEIEEKAMDALKAVGMEKLKNKKPRQLSGGQAQRVAIARSIVTDPSIILADEPTGALDSDNSRLIMELLKEISKKRLVIMVTHNEELAHEYSDRIINLKDGRLVSDTVNEKPVIETAQEKKKLNRSRLSFGMTSKLATKNMLSRKWKTVLTGIANSFGMIGIAFFLAINFGFKNYSSNLSSASATSLPVVVSAYDQKSASDSFSDKNASVTYPDKDEIYPSVTLSSSYSYNYNQFSPKYFAYLESLKKEGIVREYSLSYGNSYSFNLTTNFPQSLDGNHEGGLSEVDTTSTSYNYYAYQASLPYNIFHVLYGDMDQYDVITGSMPTSSDEIVLVVNKYNAVSFSVLQKLGFYNSYDQQEDVQDENLSTKVKPIKFSDVIGKTYRVYNNDEYYSVAEVSEVTDANGYTKEIQRYKKNDLTDDFYQNHGKELKITGIIRPKQTSPFTILSPALCYLPSLQDELMPANENSQLAKTIVNNMIFKKPSNSTGLPALQQFANELETYVSNYDLSSSTVLPTSDLNDIVNRYFNYVPYQKTDYNYVGFSMYLYDCKAHGADIVSDDLLGRDLSEQSVIDEQLAKVQKAVEEADYATFYSQVCSMVAYANAYSQISSIVIFPVDLPSRTVLMERLDEFNEIDGSETHAADESEKVYYNTSDVNALLKDVGDMISLVSMILLIFAAISLIVSSAMTALMTSNNVLERRKEIGLLRSLGSRKTDVVRLFEIEAFCVGLIAGCLGSILTFVLSYPINAMINYFYSYYEVGKICDFTWYHALIVIAFSIVIGLISSLIPSIKASRENPVDALKNE